MPNAPDHRYPVEPAAKAVMVDCGLQPASVLAEIGLPENLFDQPTTHITAREYFAIWSEMEARIDAPTFALNIATAPEIANSAPGAFVFLSSSDLGAALDRLSKFKRALAPVTFDLISSGDKYALRVFSSDANAPIPPTFALMEMVFLLNLARIATRRQLVPHSVSCVASEGQDASYQEFFGRCPQPRSFTEMVFSARDWREPFLTRSSFFDDAFVAGIAGRLNNGAGLDSVSSRVRSKLLQKIAGGEHAAELIALSLGLSLRTMQRRLMMEGTSFNALLTEVRRELARVYLRDTQYTHGEISFLLGFDEPNSFYRAFRSWFDTTPDKFRSAP